MLGKKIISRGHIAVYRGILLQCAQVHVTEYSLVKTPRLCQNRHRMYAKLEISASYMSQYRDKYSKSEHAHALNTH